MTILDKSSTMVYLESVQESTLLTNSRNLAQESQLGIHMEVSYFIQYNRNFHKRTDQRGWLFLSSK